MKSKSILLVLLYLSFNLTAQEFTVPANVSYDVEADYINQEQQVLSAIDWLMKTPVSEEQDKRKAVNGYLMQWMTGTPTVTIEISQVVAPFMECADCLMAFLAGWTKYSLENDYSKDRVAGTMAGITHTISFYELNKRALGRNSELEKLIKKQKKGELESHIKSVL
jgi:hypothetical protein